MKNLPVNPAGGIKAPDNAVADEYAAVALPLIGRMNADGEPKRENVSPVRPDHWLRYIESRLRQFSYCYH